MTSITKPFRFAIDCTRMGYKVIPTKADGTPLFTSWWDHSIEFRESDILSWQQAYPFAENISLVLGGESNVCAFDVDIDDQVIAKKLYNYISDLVPVHLKRIRTNSNRFTVIARITGNQEDVSRAKSIKFENNQCIEFYTRKKLISIFGKHRKDQSSEYSFKKGFSPLNIPVNDLSIFHSSANSLRMLFDYYYSLAEDVGMEKRDKSKEYMSKISGAKMGDRKSISGSDPFDAAQKEFETDSHSTKGIYSEKEIEFMLENLDGNDYDEWLNVGMCFYNHYEGSMEGAKRWDEWSREFPEKYDGFDSILKKYSTFSVSGGMSFDSMFKKLTREVEVPKELIEEVAKKEKEKKLNDPNPLNSSEFLGIDDFTIVSGKEYFDYMFNNFLFIAKGRGSGDEPCIVDLTKSDFDDAIISRKQMREYWKDTKVTVKKIGKKGLVTLEKIPVFDLWYSYPDRKKAWGIAYAPDKPKVFHIKDQEYFNSYIPPNVKYTEKEDKLHYFIDHVAYLFPSDKGKWFINWLAQIIQEPHKRYRTNPLSVSLHEGTGRGWLTSLITKLLGMSNFSTVDDLKSIVENPKNHYLKDSLMVVFNEVYTPKHDKQRILSRLKTYLSDDIQSIDEKYGKQSFNTRIYCRFFFQSNRLYGLPIDYEDTRIQPFINRTPPKEPEYYTTIYNLLDNDQDFLNQVYSYLRRVTINYDWLKRSTNTPDRQAILRSSVSLTSTAFSIFRNIVGEDSAFTEDDITTFVENLVQEAIGCTSTSDGFAQSGNTFNVSEFHFLKERFFVDMPPIIMYKGEQIVLRSFQVLDDSLTHSQLVEKLEMTRRKIREALDNGGYEKWITRRVEQQQ